MKLKKDPITLTVLARDAYDAETVNGLYLETVPELQQVQYTEKYSGPGWLKTIPKFPVELYLLFPNKRSHNKFLKLFHENKTAAKIIAHY